MTNEQLAEFIQQGGADDLKPILWERVKNLMYKLCGQYYANSSERFATCGVELSDLRQEMYSAYLKALESFKPAEGYLFTTYLNYPIKNVCSELLGIRNKDRQNKQPLDNCASLNAPISTEDGTEITMLSLVEDKDSQQGYENAINSIYDEQTRKVLAAALDRLDKPLRDVIVMYYFEGMTQKEIAEKAGVSAVTIRRWKEEALRKLRVMPDVRLLREGHRIERRLHFDSRANGEAYYIAQKKIHEILQGGDYLSYGQRQAILLDCKVEAALHSSPEYKALSCIEQIYGEREGKRLCSLKG